MSKTDLGAITEVVPQISYDIIGRIVPGVVVIVTLVVAIMGPAQALTYLDRSVIHADPALSGWTVLLFIIVAYILAGILDGIWQIPAYVRCPRPRIDEPNLEAPSISLKVDAVKQTLPKAGAWVTKLYAETYQMQVLIVGWLIAVAINLYCLVTAFSSERLWLEVILIAGIAGAWVGRNSICSTRETGLANLWLFLQCNQFVASVEDKAAGEEKSE